MVKAVGATSAQDFLVAIEKSGLLTAEQLVEAKKLNQSENPRDLARQLVAKSLLTKWQAGQLLNGFTSLDVGKYRLLNQLGSGHLGREFLAEHVNLRRRVALKMVSKNLTVDPERLKQFLEESRRVARLDHPNLVRSYDVDQDGQRYYVVTEFLDGGDVKALVKNRGALPLADVVGYLLQVAEGMQHATSHGVVHGDLKPANLLLDSQGALKVADLGFSRLVDGSWAPSGESSPNNDLSDQGEYRAREAKDGGGLNAKSDLFSFGQIFYFMLTGVDPPKPFDSAEKRAKSLWSPSTTPPTEAGELYAKLTEPDASKRLGTWREAIELLHALPIQASSVVIPEGESPAKTRSAPPKRKPPVAKSLAANETPVPAETTPDSEPEAPMGFMIDTGEARGKKVAVKKPVVDKRSADKPAVKQGAAANEATPASDQPKPTRGAKKKLDPRLLIGGAVGGGLVLVLLSIGILYLVLGGGKKEAKVKPGTTESSATETNAVDEGEKKPAEEAEVNPSEVNPADVPPEPTPVKGTADKPAAETKPTTEVAVATPEKVDTAPPTPAPEPTPPTTPPAVSPTPPAPEPAPPAAQPAPLGDVFAELPSVMALPEITADGAQKIKPFGKVALPAGKACLVELYCGDGPGRGKTLFTVANANNGLDPLNWEISMTSKPGETNPIVAKLHLNGPELGFEWTADAASQPQAPYLCNSILRLAVGDKFKEIVLRETAEIEPVPTVDFDKGFVIRLPFEYSPDPKLMRVEVVGLDPAMFPNSDIKPQNGIEATKASAVIWIGEKVEHRNLGLRFDTTTTAKSVDVKFTPAIRADTQSAGDKFTKKQLLNNFKTLQAQLATQTNSRQAAHAAIDAGKRPDGSAFNEEEKKSRKTLYDSSTEKLQETVQKLEAASTLLDRINKTATVHVRVTYETGLKKIVLAQTKGAPPEEPAKK